MRIAGTVVTTLSIAGAAMATGPLTVSNTMLLERHVAAADGTTRLLLVRADHAAPGDRVIVAVEYRNTGRAPITGLVLADPVPHGLSYRGPAAGSPAPELSIDGRTFAAALPAGASTAQVVALRWRLSGPLAPAGGGRLSFVASVK